MTVGTRTCGGNTGEAFHVGGWCDSAHVGVVFRVTLSLGVRIEETHHGQTARPRTRCLALGSDAQCDLGYK